MRHVHQGLFFNVSSSSKPAFSFDIKSGYLSTVNLIFRTTDLQIIEADLKTRFGDVPDFFDDDAVCIDLTALDGAVTTGLNWERLLSMLQAYRMRPIAVKGLTAASQPVALAHGLLIQPDVGNSQVIDKSETKPVEARYPTLLLWLLFRPVPWSLTSHCVRVKGSMPKAEIWLCWRWLMPVLKSLRMAIFTCMRL